MIEITAATKTARTVPSLTQDIAPLLDCLLKVESEDRETEKILSIMTFLLRRLFSKGESLHRSLCRLRRHCTNDKMLKLVKKALREKKCKTLLSFLQRVRQHIRDTEKIISEMSDIPDAIKKQIDKLVETKQGKQRDDWKKFVYGGVAMTVVGAIALIAVIYLMPRGSSVKAAILSLSTNAKIAFGIGGAGGSVVTGGSLCTDGMYKKSLSEEFRAILDRLPQLEILLKQVQDSIVEIEEAIKDIIRTVEHREDDVEDQHEDEYIYTRNTVLKRFVMEWTT